MKDTFNLAAFNVPDIYTDTELSFGFSPAPLLTFGASKVIARIAQLLLTKKGSDRTDPNAGCNLMNLVATFHTSEKGYLQSEVNNILEDISFQMLNENDNAVIPESRFKSVICDDLEIDQDVVRLNFLVTTASNNILKFILPVPIA